MRIICAKSRPVASFLKGGGKLIQKTFWQAKKKTISRIYENYNPWAAPLPRPPDAMCLKNDIRQLLNTLHVIFIGIIPNYIMSTYVDFKKTILPFDQIKDNLNEFHVLYRTQKYQKYLTFGFCSNVLHVRVTWSTYLHNIKS